MDTRARLDMAERQDTAARKESKSGVYSRASEVPTLHLVEQAVAADLPIPATVKVSESLWHRMKIEAIRRKVTVSSLAEAAFRGLLEEKQEKKARGKA